jgi:hypothetical protein
MMSLNAPESRSNIDLPALAVRWKLRDMNHRTPHRRDGSGQCSANVVGVVNDRMYPESCSQSVLDAEGGSLRRVGRCAFGAPSCRRPNLALYGLALFRASCLHGSPLMSTLSAPLLKASGTRAFEAEKYAEAEAIFSNGIQAFPDEVVVLAPVEAAG